MRVRFVTGNAGKVAEAQARLGPLGYEVEGVVVPLVEIQAEDLQAVALVKAESARGRVEEPYFVEDAGLFIDALNGFPGVYSAPAFKALGNAGILRLLPPGADRAAHFGAVIAWVDRDAPLLFNGRVDGKITEEARGGSGFGFDPIFQPKGKRKTFAEMGAAEKTAISHRGRALDALALHLRAAKD